MLRNFTAAATNPKIIFFHLGLLLLAMIFSSMANAADSTGRLLFVRGEVQIISVDAEPRAASRGDLLQVGDTIRTGAKSNAQLRMSDGAMIALKADTEFRIEAQDYNKKAPGEGSQVGELLRGGLRAITGAIGHENPKAVKYRTPVATIGIRGTVFDTIVIPAEGLPELPGMAPGTYVMVLESQVLLSSSTGELLLGAGEVGYVPFIGAPPELRPDLSNIFIEFASFEEPDGQKTAAGKDGYRRTAFTQQENGRIYTLMADVGGRQILAANTTTSATVSPGPYGIANVLATGNAITPYQGDFFSNTVTVGTTYGDLQSASGGTGGIGSYNTVVAGAPPVPQKTGSATAGNSTINWGQYTGLDVQVFDQVNVRIGIANADLVNYINATNVIISTADLPTIGSYTYNYVGGAGYALAAGSMAVNFGTANMDVALTVGPGTYSANNQAISNFYGSGINLTGPNALTQTGSSISGRFVGSGAEGAVAGYVINLGDGTAVGTAAFVR